MLESTENLALNRYKLLEEGNKQKYNHKEIILYVFFKGNKELNSNVENIIKLKNVISNYNQFMFWFFLFYFIL